MTRYSFNIIRHRGDPKEAITLTGHKVRKQEYVYFKDDKGDYQYVRCADYHNEHFIYVNPEYNEDDPAREDRPWFAMCTCGSPAVLVGPGVGNPVFNAKENLLVCMAHANTLLKTGQGQHQTSDGKRWI